MKVTNLITLLVAATVGIASCAPFSGTAPSETATLEGKSIAFVGDSISYGTNYHGGYAKLIGEEQNMTVTNPSLGGASITRNVKWVTDGASFRPCIIDMVNSLDGEYDYIIAEGGVNDFWNHAPLGELTAGFAGGYDEETFAGGLESIFYTIKENHPESKAGFVIIHDPFTYDAEESFEKYYEMMKAACDKWSVPYLDLYERNNQTAGVNVRDDEVRRLYFASSDRPDGDGTHPNELGYQTIYVDPMVEWLKTL